MIHYTLNTGHTRQSPRSEVDPQVIESLQPLLVNGLHPLPVAGYRAQITIEGTALRCTVRADRESRPLVSFGVATTEEDEGILWSAVQQLYHQLTDLPGLRSADFRSAQKPQSLPWCAAMTILMLPGESWVADFERCLAWAWCDHVKDQQTGG